MIWLLVKKMPPEIVIASQETAGITSELYQQLIQMLESKAD
jgi:hypothetical protein